MELQASSEAALNRLFYIRNAIRRRRDDRLNGIHRNALSTVSFYLGTGHYDYIEFFAGQLSCGRLRPF